ncbi:TerD family protein [Streptomyces cavernicola]|uniref:TerD family protein n=1 Tax=Streptomyces cavernicola TaxID=3043613 RepID=A0ABT6S337_9ACTN|nr:TerD family protein [Streptomyces sp. B-S-A6]MDI3402509.1 TerD family protein [Streptomyces sp. B-S-A6]
MSSVKKGLGKVEVALRWDPSPMGAPEHDLDLVAAAYTEGAGYAEPEYVVHFDSRSPDGTINLNRDSRTGQGFGYDEVMTLEFDRLAESYTRVVVGVVIQQNEDRKTFADIENTGVRIAEGYTELATSDLAEAAGGTAATIAEFTRDPETGTWEFRSTIRGFDADPTSFAAQLGALS